MKYAVRIARGRCVNIGLIQYRIMMFSGRYVVPAVGGEFK